MVPRPVLHALDGLNAVLAITAALVMGSWIRGYAELRRRERRTLDLLKVNPEAMRDFMHAYITPIEPWGLDGDDVD